MSVQKTLAVWTACSLTSEELKMARVKRGVQARRRHKKILDLAKGYYNARRKVFRVAKQAVIKAQQYAYIGTVSRRSATSVRCGSPVSMRLPASTA